MIEVKSIQDAAGLWINEHTQLLTAPKLNNGIWTALANYHGTLALIEVSVNMLPSDTPISTEAAPIPMILHCPECHKQHIDVVTETWSNPPHRSHECQFCKCIWRPADVPTTGVEQINTKGRADTWSL